MEYLSPILTVALIHLLAVISPGPDFVMIVRNSLMYSRKTGYYSAIGLGLGIMLHIIYSLIGIGLIISQSVILFTIIKILGACYLLYIGIKSLISKTSHVQLQTAEHKRDITPIKAIQTGFITNATNPKATLFFLSLFTLVIKPETPFLIKLIMGTEMVLVTILWFCFVAYIISHPAITKYVNRIQHYSEKVIGIVLIIFGLKIAFSGNK